MDLDVPVGLTRGQDETRGSTIGPSTTSGTWIQHPWQDLTVEDEPMTVSIDDGSGARKASSQPRVPVACWSLMAMDHHQPPTRQIDREPVGDLIEQLTVALGPGLRDIIVAAHGEHATPARLQLGKHTGLPDVSTVDREVTGGHQVGDPVVQRAMRVRQDRDPGAFILSRLNDHACPSSVQGQGQLASHVTGLDQFVRRLGLIKWEGLGDMDPQVATIDQLGAVA